jgi:fructose 1,6-bisphosphatase
MNAQSPRPHFGPSIPLLFAVVTPAVCTLTRVGSALAALAIASLMRGWLRHADARPLSHRRRNELDYDRFAVPAMQAR